jgi:hypothetical protein
MSNATRKALACMVDAQNILVAAMTPSADCRATVDALAALLCGPEANFELYAAGAFDDTLGEPRVAVLAAV